MVEQRKCGLIAVVGRPNVGKSTLINHIVGEPVCITSHKRQTTRHQIMAIKTVEQSQLVFVDTPGIHQDGKKAMNRYMNRAAKTSLHDVDMVVWLLDSQCWTKTDEHIFSLIEMVEVPVILLLNKVDLLEDRQALLPKIADYQERFDFAQIIPISAMKGINTDALEEELIKRLPAADFMFDEAEITNRSNRFLASEIVREKLTRNLSKELPYELTVEIEHFEAVEADRLRICAVVYVERASQKAIIIGKGGQKMKVMATQARLSLQKLFDRRVHLEVWVKVKSGWADDDRALTNLGYD